MKYLHTMIRVSDVAETLRFFELLGLKELRRIDNEGGRFSLIFLAAPGDEDAQVELTIIGMRAAIPAGAISAISPMRWMISMRRASA